MLKHIEKRDQIKSLGGMRRAKTGKIAHLEPLQPERSRAGGDRVGIEINAARLPAAIASVREKITYTASDI